MSPTNRRNATHGGFIGDKSTTAGGSSINGDNQQLREEAVLLVITPTTAEREPAHLQTVLPVNKSETKHYQVKVFLDKFPNYSEYSPAPLIPKRLINRIKN
ncbi:hypothetical protein LZD49_02460 [Dyadobacter sp. CY261]|uniref:hypothetical protein n=1 Tax=Dyadobacter sp. CY261 TaxID=2907203 RepID=UPI001F361DEC|nr:hypothetical protein [Dyadobacter sp. CY261]MCF0069316.1 hypothetical protein [Dyadobacter sp. CY261]